MCKVQGFRDLGSAEKCCSHKASITKNEHGGHHYSCRKEPCARPFWIKLTKDPRIYTHDVDDMLSPIMVNDSCRAPASWILQTVWATPDPEFYKADR